MKTFKDYISENTLIGKTFWFEYHCLESKDSCDVELWKRSQQKVKVLSIKEYGEGKTKLERLDNGTPRIYKIKFNDGFTGDAFEDELIASPKNFERPAPPKDL